MLANTFHTLLGLSIGDAYGIHFEFMSQEDIADSYLEKPQTSLGGGPFQFLPGDFSDDTEMALLTLYSLMQKRYVDTHHIKALYTLWSYHAKDVGIQTQRALQQGIIDPKGEGNGALMRILPSIVYMHDVLHWDNEKIKNSVHAISSITHDSLNIHRINNFFVDLILGKNILQHAHASLIVDLLRATGNNGWVINTARIVWFRLMERHLSLLDGMWKIISYGGDTDTACAIYGAIKAYKDPESLQSLQLDVLLNRKSQKVLETFLQTRLHYYQPDNQLFPTLFAGQYPGSKNAALHAIKLYDLEMLNIDCIVSLMEVSESKRFTPYQQTLMQRNPKIEFFNYPITDMSVPTKKQLYDIVHHIQTLLTSKKRVYIHCWGGHGRTGVVVGALLIYNGYTPQNALAKIKEERMKTPFKEEPSPQTDEQIEFILNTGECITNI